MTVATSTPTSTHNGKQSTPAVPLVNRILAVDPGNLKSGMVDWEWLQPDQQNNQYHCYHKGHLDNEAMLTYASAFALAAFNNTAQSNCLIAIERITLYQSCDYQVHDTILFYGRLIQAVLAVSPQATVWFVPRSTVRSHITRQQKANDGLVKKALKDRFGWSPKRKDNPYPLTAGMDDHSWQALGVAAYCHDLLTHYHTYQDQQSLKQIAKLQYKGFAELIQE